MKSEIYPPANRTAQWYEGAFLRGTFPIIEKIMLHTTETSSWPGYAGGSEAPTLTYDPVSRQWRQHNYLNTSARALSDPASTPVRENRDNVIQIEIVWFAAKIDQLPATAYLDLADFVAYVRKEWGGPSLVSATFVGSSLAPKAHMSSLQYDAFNGILGHQHAPVPSTHWDPGAFDGNRLISLVKKMESTPTEEPMPTAAEIATEVWDNTFVTRTRPDGTTFQVSVKQELADAKGAAQAAAAKNIDVNALASAVATAVAAQLGTGGGLTTAQVQSAAEAGVRHVLGTLDNVPTA